MPVSWMVSGNLPHIGIVLSRRSADGKHPLIVHHIGRGPWLEDMLFDSPRRWASTARNEKRLRPGAEP